MRIQWSAELVFDEGEDSPIGYRAIGTGHSPDGALEALRISLERARDGVASRAQQTINAHALVLAHEALRKDAP